MFVKIQNTYLLAIASLIIAIFMTLMNGLVAHAASVTQVSTGTTSTCAVVDYKAKCWGSNASGILGNGSSSSSATPVDVYAQAAWTETVPRTCSGTQVGSNCWFGSWVEQHTVAHPASPLGGKSVEKVSVGTNHACALADARVYCWGDNTYGQLGNRDSGAFAKQTTPIAVDIAAAVVKTCLTYSNNGKVCQKYNTPTDKPASALRSKEIIDISAGDEFSCALASDGSVACWGKGDDGRLGNNNTSDKNYPVSIYTKDAFAGKKGIKLAKASGEAMCVLAVDSSATVVSASGQPYCWGYGIDSGASLPESGDTDVACSKSSPTNKPRETSETVIFQSAKPVKIPGETFAAMDGGDYITGLATSGRAYYWGMYGYTQTTSYPNTRSCSVSSCASKASIGIQLARYNHSTGGNTTGGHNQQNSQGQNVGGGDSCNNSTHYGYTKRITVTETGQKVATVPPKWPSMQSGIVSLSGNSYNGLFCANQAVASCDSHGTSMTEGQTGSNYVQSCSQKAKNPAFPQYTVTTCDGDPIGPQTVYMQGWLAGKSITMLSTSMSGYSCAIAGGTVGCWGKNTYGQLGIGDTNNRKAPTGVNL